MTEKAIEKSYREGDEYRVLVEQCQAIITESVFRARVEVIVAHGQIGELISTSGAYRKHGKGNQDFIKELAGDIGISTKEAYLSIQFYEKFKIVSPEGESWNRFEEGKSVSWDKIKKHYLAVGDMASHTHSWETIQRCKICKRIKS